MIQILVDHDDDRPVGRRWRVRQTHGAQPHLIFEDGYRRLRDAIGAAVRAAKALLPESSQVVVKGRDGRFRTEWTYPRSADPRRSAG